MKRKNYLEVYDEFWKNIVENEDGTLNAEQIKKELSDYYFMLEEVPKVYDDVTEGRIGNPMTYASEVINIFREKHIRPSDIFYGEDLEELIDDEMSFKEYIYSVVKDLIERDDRDYYDKEKIINKINELYEQND